MGGPPGRGRTAPPQVLPAQPGRRGVRPRAPGGAPPRGPARARPYGARPVPRAAAGARHLVRRARRRCPMSVGEILLSILVGLVANEVSDISPWLAVRLVRW